MGEDFPQKFGQYTLHELIGRGGMAEIYRASMPGIGGFEKTVAIKKILPHLAQDDEFTTMLVDEARIIESLDHSNIAQVFDLGKLDGSYYIAMEYIHGVDLSDVIEELEERGDRIPIPHVIYIVSSICAGLHFAHSKTDEEGNPLNVIHRDISPHNIRISFAGEVKIIDFGVAKAADREARTKMGVIKGKLLYMAPEQAKAENLDGRADLFSAGLCAYRMLTGELPFEGDNEFQVYNNVLQQEITPPQRLRSEIPDELNRIVMQLLERDPDDRYQDGYAAKQDLDTLLHEIAPGYTVNRLSRFIEENFSHLVQTDEAGTQSETSNPSGLSPSTPSRPTPGTGNRNTDDLDPQDEPPDPARENVPASESTDGATQAARPQEISPADRSSELRRKGDHQPAAQSQERPVETAEPAEDREKPRDDAPPIPPVVYAIAGLIVAIVGMIVYAASVGGNHSENAGRIQESGRGAEAVAASESMVRVQLDSSPSSATLIRKGETVGRTPTKFALPKSDKPLQLTLEKEGYRRTTVEFVPNGDFERTIELSPVAGGDAPDAGGDGTSGEPGDAGRVAQRSNDEGKRSGSEGGRRPAESTDNSTGSPGKEGGGGAAAEKGRTDETASSDSEQPDEASESDSPSATDDSEKTSGDEGSSDDESSDEIIDPFDM